MKKSFLLFIIVLLTASSRLVIAQTANTPINFTPAGDFYSGYRQSLVIVGGVTYADGISDYFHKNDQNNFVAMALPIYSNYTLDPGDIKEIKVRNRTAAELLCEDNADNGPVIIEAKKDKDK